MSSKTRIMNDDECDSNFVCRKSTREAFVKIEDDIQLNKIKDEPQILTNKKRPILQFNNKYTFHTKIHLEEESDYDDYDDNASIYDSSSGEDDNDDPNNSSASILLETNNDDLTDLSWLLNYKISDHVGKLLEDIDNKEDDCDMIMIKKRPNMSYSRLIYMAIEASPYKRSTLKQIYSWIMLKYPFYKCQPLNKWNSAIKHNLNNNSLFRKIDSSWSLNSNITYPIKYLNDVPETLSFHQDATSPKKKLKSSPKITNVSKSSKLRSSCEQSITNDCVNAANALLMIKSSNNQQKVSSCESTKISPKSLQNGKRKLANLNETQKNVEDIEEFSTDSEFDFSESDENLSTLSNVTSHESTTTTNDLRNALLELSRAAELLEERNKIKKC